MPRSLVTTKLRIPRRRPTLVARPRLSEILARTEERKLTLVSAPAGFGKTTLLIEWSEELSSAGRSVAWLSLEESDSDPARFLAYLVSALQSVEEGIGEGVLAALRSPQPPPLEAVMGTLVNELADLPQEIAIVLDDYHLIDSESVHALLTYLLEHLPGNSHLIISSRIDPPLALPRLRARNQLIQITASQLRFTTQEASSFLTDVMGLELSSQEVLQLEERTEGWVAALQLAALSMQGRKDASAFVEAFICGTHRDVLDFLTQEVLQRQPIEVRHFLLKSSILDQLSGSLCDALMGREDSQLMLERLERNNLFVVALDDERSWYRYHHLFRDFLRSWLNREESPALIEELHKRAAAWYERHGLYQEAVEHAFASADHELAGTLIEGVVAQMWFRGEVLTLLGWLEALGEEVKRRRVRLLLEQATALMWVGRLEGVEALVGEAERIVEGGEQKGEKEEGKEDLHRRYLLGYAAASRAWHANLVGDSRQGVEYARRALELLPEDPRPRTFAALSLGEALRTTGDLAAASEVFAEAAELGRSVGHVYGALTAMVWQARVQAARGRLREAEASFRRARQFVTEQGAELLPAAGPAHLGMGALLYERNELQEAERELESGLELAERTREVSNLIWGYVTLSRVKRARGDEGGALEKAREAERVSRASGAGLEIAIATAWMARLHLARGDIAGAVALEKERAASAEHAADAARVVDSLTSARVLHARGQLDEALGLLERLRGFAEASGITGGLTEILALQALVLWAKGERERAVSTLTRALIPAEPEDFVRTIVDEGPVMVELLSAVLEARHSGRLEATGRVSARYLAKLLAALGQEAGASRADERSSEALSERELEVLALIAAGESNGEIAARLFVSISTVKTHINNLYRKLGAHGRTRAVARARELGLL